MDQNKGFLSPEVAVDFARPTIDHRARVVYVHPSGTAINELEVYSPFSVLIYFSRRDSPGNLTVKFDCQLFTLVAWLLCTDD